MKYMEQNILYTPEKYELFFNINIKKLIYTGKVIINLKILKQTNLIKINCQKIIIINLLLNNKEYYYNYDKKYNLIIIENNFLINHIYTIEVNFLNKIEEKMEGIYYSKKNKNIIISTQFEPNYARMVFPCFDEPFLKSQFKIKIALNKNYNCLSNMPLNLKKEININNQVYYIYDFLTTPLISTYLLAFVIGNIYPVFDKPLLTNSKKKINGYCINEIKENLLWSVVQTKNAINYFEDYFKINYTLPKLDIIPIPNFSAGAMENWGLVTFREVNLLLYGNDIINKIRIVEVIYHEIAHQWFGNLVTLNNWNNLWLNESFATYFAWEGVQYTFPKLPIDSINYLENYYTALFIDGLPHTHAIIPKNINQIDDIFDEISYSKGSCLINYISYLIGKEEFKIAITEYLENNEFSNTDTNTLLYYIQKTYDELEIKNQLNIYDLFNNIVSQTGFPILEVYNKNNKIYISVKKFKLTGKTEDYILPIFISIIEYDHKYNKISILKLDKMENELNLKNKFNLNIDNSLFCIINYKINISTKNMKPNEYLKFISDKFILAYYSIENIFDYLIFLDLNLDINNKNLDIINFKYILTCFNKIFKTCKLKNNKKLFKNIKNTIFNSIFKKLFILVEYFFINNKYFINDLIDELLILFTINLKIKKFILLSKHIFLLNVNNFLTQKTFYLSKSLFKIINYYYPNFTIIIINLLKLTNISPHLLTDIINSFEYINYASYKKIIKQYKNILPIQEHIQFYCCLLKNSKIQKYVLKNIFKIKNEENIIKIMKHSANYIFKPKIKKQFIIFIKTLNYKLNNISINRILDVLESNNNILINL